MRRERLLRRHQYSIITSYLVVLLYLELWFYLELNDYFMASVCSTLKNGCQIIRLGHDHRFAATSLAK